MLTGRMDFRGPPDNAPDFGAEVERVRSQATGSVLGPLAEHSADSVVVS
jgi:hypothetical protein